MRTQVKSIWQRDGRRRFAITALLVLAGGCTELPGPAKAQVAEARNDYLKRDLASARTKLDDVLTHYSLFTGAAEAYYLRAKINAESSNKAAAERDAKQCIQLAQDSELKAKANAMAGTLAFETGDDNAAAGYFADAVKHLPEKPPADLVRFRYGLCLQRLGRWDEARTPFGVLIVRSPTSDLAEHARRMYEWRGDYYSIQCGAFQDGRAASQLASKLKNAGLAARVEPRGRLGQTLHYVLVGQYPTYVLAEQALGSVRRHVSGAVIAP